MDDRILQFLHHEMSEEDKQEFLKELEANPELKEQLQEYQNFEDLTKLYFERKAGKQKLDNIYKLSEGKLKKQYSRVMPRKSFNIYHIVISSVIAALLAIAAISAIFYKVILMDYNQKLTEYSDLKNDINKISYQQKSIWNKLLSSEKSNIHYSGTGFAISQEGLLVTSFHLVGNFDTVMVSQFTDTIHSYKARVVFKASDKDIALLQIVDSTFTGFSDIPYRFYTGNIELGDYVFTLGFTKKDIVFNDGSISSLTGYNGDSSSFQVSISANPGNSGGPVITEKGEIIGIISGKNITREETTYARRADNIIACVDSFNTHSQEQKIKLPVYNRIRWLNKQSKIKGIIPYIFRVEVKK